MFTSLLTSQSRQRRNFLVSFCLQYLTVYYSFCKKKLLCKFTLLCHGLCFAFFNQQMQKCLCLYIYIYIYVDIYVCVCKPQPVMRENFTWEALDLWCLTYYPWPKTGPQTVFNPAR